MDNIEMDIADVIMERPKGFSIGHRHFFLYPMTLGKAYIVKRVVKALGIDDELMKEQPFLEALRMVKEKRKECALLLAYHSFKEKQDVMNPKKVNLRKQFFLKELEDIDMASLIIYSLSMDKTKKIMQHLGIDKELERMQRVMKVKQTKNTYQFGGMSVYGSIIDSACERYGWEFDYVLWGISYTNLRLMLCDSVKTVYLTDKEAKKCHVPQRGRTINGNDESQLLGAIRSCSWK